MKNKKIRLHLLKQIRKITRASRWHFELPISNHKILCGSMLFEGSTYCLKRKNSARQNRAIKSRDLIKIDASNLAMDLSDKDLTFSILGFNGDGTAQVSLGYTAILKSDKSTWDSFDNSKLMEEIAAIKSKLDPQDLKRYLMGDFDATFIKQAAPLTSKANQSEEKGAVFWWPSGRAEDLPVKRQDDDS